MRNWKKKWKKYQNQTNKSFKGSSKKKKIPDFLLLGALWTFQYWSLGLLHLNASWHPCQCPSTVDFWGGPECTTRSICLCVSKSDTGSSLRRVCLLEDGGYLCGLLAKWKIQSTCLVLDNSSVQTLNKHIMYCPIPELTCKINTNSQPVTMTSHWFFKNVEKVWIDSSQDSSTDLYLCVCICE